MNEIPKTMQAVVYRGVNDLRLEIVPVPRIGAKELLVKVAVCGVCPTDIKKILHGTLTAPRIFGHETAGTIVRVGARVQKWRVGERVALHHHVPCMNCAACRHAAFAQCPVYKRTGITAGFEPAGGGYAEYVRVMPFVFPGIVKIPPRNSFAEGAMLEPVNTVLKAVKRLGLIPGDSVWVIGQGPIGLMFTRLLSAQGMKVLATDLFDARLKMAHRFGAKWVLRSDDKTVPEEAMRLARGAGFDAAVLCAPSNEAVHQAQDLVRGAGKVLLFAHTLRGKTTELDLSKICVDEKDLIGSYSSDITLQPEAARWVFTRKLDVRQLITHQFPLPLTAQAVRKAANPDPHSLKIIVSLQPERFSLQN
jgi:L-iditol 2-dehydrogenase